MSNAEEFARPDSPQELNAEIDDLYAEIEDLHAHIEMLMGFIAGGYGYFLQQLIQGHRQGTGISAATCEQLVIDALKRIQSTQQKFEVDFLAEIQAVLLKMSQPTTLAPYADKAFQERDR